jgi:hypothetical protein
MRRPGAPASAANKVVSSVSAGMTAIPLTLCLRLRPETEDLLVLSADPERQLLAAVKTALRNLARRWRNLDEEINGLNRQIEALVRITAPELVALHGVGVELAGQSWHSRRQPKPHPHRGSLRQALRRRTTAGKLRTHRRPAPTQPRR